MSQIVITAVGPDRPGIVGELTGHLHQHGGNILDSRMVNLRGQFAILILLDIPYTKATALAAELPSAAEAMGLKLSVTAQEHAAPPASGLPFHLKTYSLDQPGIVARVSSLLRERGVNIEELNANQESAPFAGSPLFITQMRLTVPASVQVRQLRADLEALCNQLNCDVDLEPR